MNQPLEEPSLEDLLDLLDGRLGPTRRALIDAVGPGAQQLGRWIRAVTADARRLPLVAPPALVSQRLRRLAAIRDGIAPPLDRMIAQPATDSRRIGRPAGMRGPNAEPTSRYQLSFEAPGTAVVVIDVAESDDIDGVILRGQVLPQRQTLPVFEATALGPSGVISSIIGDELGGFELRGVPLDATRLFVSNDEVEIEMAFRLSDAPA